MRTIIFCVFMLIFSSASAVWLSYCTDDDLGFGPAYMYGVRFTLPESAGHITRVSIYSVAFGFTEGASIWIYLFHVVNGIPTTLISSGCYTVSGGRAWRIPSFFNDGMVLPSQNSWWRSNRFVTIFFTQHILKTAIYVRIHKSIHQIEIGINQQVVLSCNKIFKKVIT